MVRRMQYDSSPRERLNASRLFCDFRSAVRPCTESSQERTSGNSLTVRLEVGGYCTSNGESYDPKSLTAASRSLPLGSTVKVTDVNNGRSVNVRTNDRGPYVRGRSLDLSSHAAENIALGDKGLAKVKITQRAAAGSTLPAPCD